MVCTTQGEAQFSPNLTSSALILCRILKNKPSGFKTNAEMKYQQNAKEIGYPSNPPIIAVDPDGFRN